MKVICSGRKTSRTTQLIEMCAEAEARGEVSYIVCRSQPEAYRVHQKAIEMGLTIGFPIRFDEFLKGQYDSHNVKNLFIDNADYLLQDLAKVNIAAIVVEKTE